MKVAKGELHTPSGRVQGAELVTLKDVITSISQVSVPASGSNTTQFTFLNSKGQAVGSARVLSAYLSDVNGLPVAAITSWAAAVNGWVDPLVTGKIHNVGTTAAGLLGILFTGTAATRYCTFILPNDQQIISGPLVIN